MIEIIKDIEQGSEEWHEMRLAVITASRFKDVLAGGQGKTRFSYMRELAAEALTGEAAKLYSNEYMEWGVQTEPQAKSMYELRTGNSVEEVAFVRDSDFSGVGVSPDGLIAEDGLIEIKCPKTTTQIETFLSGDMPKMHKAQVQGQLWITGRSWCDFVSFDPRIDGAASWFCVRIERDQDYINTLQSKVLDFKNELDLLLTKLRG